MPSARARSSASKARPAGSPPSARATTGAPARSPPDRELLHGGGAKGVARDQHDPLALAAHALGELAMVVVLLCR